ncbi:dTDP-4-dehydrorhamnose reductase [Marinomonas dokdonensis]|uniref:dTDP-4-dehydrorhamnose reductase n=1 Tax=Marinomonas dokdonensis TaxID=328224 RepID=UPI00405543B0
MKVLVTGVNGQVGSCLVKLLKKKKILVLAVDKKSLDISNQVDVMKTVLGFSPDFIINAAAYTSVDQAEDDIENSFAINCDGPKYLARAAEDCGAVFLHISTDYVFDGNGEDEYVENDLTAPQSVYGESKLAGELAVAEVCTKYLIVRTAWVFCEHGNNFVKTMLKLAQTRDELSIVDDQIGGPTYAGDIAKALISMVEFIENGNEPEWGVYHFSGMPYVSWFEFADYIFAAAKKKSLLDNLPSLYSVPTSTYPTPAKRPANSRLDCRKIEQQFGVKPSDWQASLDNIEAYK